MSNTPDEQPVQSPRAWRSFTRELGASYPTKLGQLRRLGKQVRAQGLTKPKPKGGK